MFFGSNENSRAPKPIGWLCPTQRCGRKAGPGPAHGGG
jgi:hypothetical protein